MFEIFRSHRLADLVLATVLILGAWAYFAMPRAQYPEVNLNWVAVAVVWPGASAQDLEREVAIPLEMAARRVPDVRLAATTSRDNVATLLVRFRDLSHNKFERRLVALDREIRQAAAGFPKDARPPQVIELTSSNFFPTAMVAVTGDVADGRICRLAQATRAQLEGIQGVGKVWAYGLRNREIAVNFDPAALARERISPETLTRTVMDQARTLPAGMADVSGRRYAIRVEGLSANPDLLADLPLATADGRQVPLSEVARVTTGVAPARELVTMDGKPAVLLSVTKAENVNTVRLTKAIQSFVKAKNKAFGAQVLTLVDDQSQATLEAIGVMEANALFGLAVVLLVTWFFLGKRMAVLTSLGVPFALAGMFLALYLMGQTLNVSVLLGVAIVLGVPLDDAVVVAEAIRLRLGAGMDRNRAVAEAMKEVARPVTASVLATCMAFTPLLFLPGLMGDFMFVTPLAVIITLLASMAASLWILPGHAAAWGGMTPGESWRNGMERVMRRHYGRALAWAFRHPLPIAAVFGLLFLVMGLSLQQEWVKPRWFASDPLRVFNLNIQAPPASNMETTLKLSQAAERVVHRVARPGELTATLASAGLQFTPSELVTGDNLGQVTVSLAPESTGARGVDDFVDALRPALRQARLDNVSIQVLSADLPMLSSLSLRLTGAPVERLAAAADDLRRSLEQTPGFTDLRDDASANQPRLTLRVNADTAARNGLDPFKLAALIRLHFEGITVGKVMDGEESVDLAVRGQPMSEPALQRWLKEPWRLPDGRSVDPAELFTVQFEAAPSELRRVNGERTVTVHAPFDQDRLTARHAVEAVEAAWRGVAVRHPGVAMSLGGEMDDVKSSLNDLLRLLVLGFLLMYGLLAIQFGRLGLPLVILATAPMALAGVVVGLLVSGQPLTLYTLYGCVALSGVAVNASIVLAAAGEERLAMGMSPVTAAFRAARRRLVPIIITTLTVIGGLISLAFGWGGQSLLWGPVANAIVWGLTVATPLTLFVTPLMHALDAGACAGISLNLRPVSQCVVEA